VKKNTIEGIFLRSMQPVMVDVVAKSFDNHKGDITSGMTNERIGICLEIVKMLRFDFGWSRQKISDNLPLYLSNELNGISWDPEKEKNFWIPPSSGV